MYAVIRAGGKQHKVAPGDVIEVERLSQSEGDVSFTPLLVVDDDGAVRSTADQLSKATVTAKVLGDSKGKKLHVFKYKNKTRYRRKIGHRQKYTTLEIGDIKPAGAKAKKGNG